jgi:Tfp pilus assembly protein PilF
LAEHENPTYQELAGRVLGNVGTGELVLPVRKGSSLPGLFHSKIADSKRRVKRDPRNPIAWADMARRYTALGQFEQAQKALRIAGSLAPNSRYILRISSRFFVHIGDPAMASHLLRQSPRTTEDPWLMAALLSATSLAGRPLPGKNVARRILDSGRFEPIENSDLVSELGTLEMKAGDDRRARKLFRQSLVTPTDNSLAQVEWASHKLRSLDVQLDAFDVPFAAEAVALSAAQRGDWATALSESVRWLDDQPFDSDAAMHGSYVAAVGLEDWEQSRAIAEIGLRSNPTHPTLANNLAYALVEMGRLAEALAPLRTAALNVSEQPDRVAILATTGLLAFRQGDADSGRDLYRQSIELSKRLNDTDAETMARSMLLREEVRAGQLANALALLEALEKLAARVQDLGVLRCVERAAGLVESSGQE